MSEMTLTTEFTTLTPSCCNTTFAVPEYTYKRWQDTGEGWFCPSCGSSRVFTAPRLKSKNDEIKRLKDRLVASQKATTRETQRRTHAERCAAAQKGAKTKIKNRISKGVCPCCNRTFQNLMKHMQGQHPGYVDNQEGK